MEILRLHGPQVLTLWHLPLQPIPIPAGVHPSLQALAALKML